MNSWVKQPADSPLYPDLLWSKPENKRHAGKLLIIGGNASSFAKVSEAYSDALGAGAGHIRVLLPDRLQKPAGMIPGVEFAPSTKSGGFASRALAEMIDLSAWADGVLLAGDFSKSSETVKLIDAFLLRSIKNIFVTPDTLNIMHVPYEQLLKKEISLLLDLKTMQQINKELRSTVAITSETPNHKLAEHLSSLASGNPAAMIYIDDRFTWVGKGGQVISSPRGTSSLEKIAAYCSVWLMQQPNKPLEALACALYESGR